MYQKKSHGWYKHKDFILLDLICMFGAFILAYIIRNHNYIDFFSNQIYCNTLIFLLFADLIVIILFESYTGVLRRGYYRELNMLIKQIIIIELAAGLYLFTVDDGRGFSRAVLYFTGVIYVILSYAVRLLWKKHLIRMMAERGEHSLYIVTSSDVAESVIQSIRQHNYNRYDINGIIITDCTMVGKEIAGIPVVATIEDAAGYICQHWVDEVLINVGDEHLYPQKLYEELIEMGIVVHVNLSKIHKTPGQKQFVERIGDYTVITTSMNYSTDRQAMLKRLLDIAGGLVGCVLTGIIFIFIAPAIYISSPGPIFFSQTRIGKNGKPFKMYKFRSMYMDAEARKAELMSQNKMSDGRMFKLDFDPRVIGNKILPDGRKKTGIGEFIRKTSLDEFPQFWNVLNGVLILVCTAMAVCVHRKKLNIIQAAAVLALVVFLGIVFGSTVFTRTGTIRQYELVPFWSWRDIIRYHDWTLLKENLLNCILLLPAGVLLPIIANHKVKWYQALAVGILVSAIIEFSQLIFMRGLFEWDDMIHNGLGCMIGCLFANILQIFS